MHVYVSVARLTYTYIYNLLRLIYNNVLGITSTLLYLYKVSNVYM